MPVLIKRFFKNYMLNLKSLSVFARGKKSLCLWNEDINTEIKLNIESHWSACVNEKSTVDNKKKQYYVLPMFPYPSGNLHMGHVRVYTISDTIARFEKLCGKNVIHPMGWDSFGLPAENAAIERNVQPSVWTTSNIDSMKTQLVKLGFNFDWDREVSTCDPKYYKWTQYIFLKLFENGLVYQNKALVNWDPVDKTVLADEQVDDSGYSWRSGAKVEKKYLKQWFIKTTKFAKELYEGLNNEKLQNWKDIINLQKHWIGECNGLVVNFKLIVDNEVRKLEVWTSNPHKLLHGEFLTISNDNVNTQELLKLANGKLTALNPITNNEIPVFIADNVNYPEGRDVYIACPSTDPDDENLAKTLNVLVNHNVKIKNIDEEDKKAIELACSKNIEGYFVSSKLKDWLISRQRYWGTPIPIIHCDKCGQIPVPYKDLPVQLPSTDSKGDGFKSLSSIDDWVNCKCPKCQSAAKRETDTMDTFVDSSWYYCRFLDPHNTEIPFSKNAVSENIPVDIYIGGKEHAVLHLYYARFMNYFLNSIGWNNSKEPFEKLLVQGMVMGQSYKIKSSGKYISSSNVEKKGKKYFEKDSGEQVLVQWEKMSKSKYNGENPEKLLSNFGCDTTRLLILADVPPATSRNWSEATFPGVLNWQHRLWITLRDFINHRNDSNICNNKTLTAEQFEKYESKLRESRNYFIATTTFHFKYSQKLSVGISRLQGLTNVLRNNMPSEIIAQSKEYETSLASLIIMLSPVAPHFCSELWAGLLEAPNRLNKHLQVIDWEANVLNQKWPIVDKDYGLSFLCKVDGVDKCDLKLKSAELGVLSEDIALDMVMKDESVLKNTKRGILRTKLEVYPNCRAILNIFTNRSTSQEKIKIKQ